MFPISGDNPSIGIVFNNISLNNDWYNDYCETHLGKESPLNIYRFINTTTNDLIVYYINNRIKLLLNWINIPIMNLLLMINLNLKTS